VSSGDLLATVALPSAKDHLIHIKSQAGCEDYGEETLSCLCRKFSHWLSNP